MNGPLQYLSHGKALCGRVFARFVETYNGLVDFCANLRGDDDVSPGAGRVTVDRSDPAHPVIRCKGCGGNGDASGGGGDPGGDPGGGAGGDTGGEETSSGVTSVNGADGEVSVVGGKGIAVSTSGKTITISYQEGKEPDEEAKSPCDHDEGGGAGGGIMAGWGGGDYGGGAGGVPAGGDGHPGDDNCNECD